MAFNLPTLAEIERERRGPLVKPSPLAAKVRKHERKQERRKAKDEADRVEAAIESDRRAQAFRRDLGRCRVFGTPLVLHTDNPLKIAHCHHVVFKSDSGSDELFNRATLSPWAHELIHTYRRVTVTGNGNETLICRLVDPETGRVLQEWESVAGKRVVGAPKVSAERSVR